MFVFLNYNLVRMKIPEHIWNLMAEDVKAILPDFEADLRQRFDETTISIDFQDHNIKDIVKPPLIEYYDRFARIQVLFRDVGWKSIYGPAVQSRIYQTLAEIVTQSAEAIGEEHNTEPELSVRAADREFDNSLGYMVWAPDKGTFTVYFDPPAYALRKEQLKSGHS